MAVLWHIMIHEMRHTAQIAVLLRIQGIKPPSLDLLLGDEILARIEKTVCALRGCPTHAAMRLRHEWAPDVSVQI